jgi:hypothetical protein
MLILIALSETPISITEYHIRRKRIKPPKLLPTAKYLNVDVALALRFVMGLVKGSSLFDNP